MVYYVIGLMSGSSHDGLDINYVEITDVRNDWSFEILHSDCIPFESNMKAQLKDAIKLSVTDFLKLNTSFGRWIGEEVNKFIERHQLVHKVHFIASHGHTVFHDPQNKTSTQIGEGASIAAITNITTISDLRNMDVALGGQGAPIVPIADRLFFKDFEYCLNIGGICNITYNNENPIAFDIAPANQVLNFYANKLGKEYDSNGDIAAEGTINIQLFEDLNKLDFYQKSAPKSLANSYSNHLIDIITESRLESISDILATLVEHIAYQIASVTRSHNDAVKLLVSGGGAHNLYLMDRLGEHLQKKNIELIIPQKEIIDNKEALAMALLGVLRWREENNVLCSVTGASRNSIGGAMWLGNL
ncbi:MAG TPA: anhydro-N-acetylmuramic acid kinase [Edaphocola sp.]|nr:anhydro-N-acetylmuramic acid kinase [Edaphocola sp.]